MKILRSRNPEDVDPRVLEIETAYRNGVLATLHLSFQDPNDTFAWLVITWTLSFIILSMFTSIQLSVVLSILNAVLLGRYRKQYCVE